MNWLEKMSKTVSHSNRGGRFKWRRNKDADSEEAQTETSARRRGGVGEVN